MERETGTKRAAGVTGEEAKGETGGLDGKNKKQTGGETGRSD